MLSRKHFVSRLDIYIQIVEKIVGINPDGSISRSYKTYPYYETWAEMKSAGMVRHLLSPESGVISTQALAGNTTIFTFRNPLSGRFASLGYTSDLYYVQFDVDDFRRRMFKVMGIRSENRHYLELFTEEEEMSFIAGP
jgi:hypothetical protein